MLTIDSGAASWEAASSGGSGCTLSASTGGTATLDCGGTPIRLATAENYIDLVDERTRLRADGTVKDFTVGAPTGVFASLFGNEDVRCGIDAVGSVTCWPLTIVGQVVQPPLGSYQSGTCGAQDVCCAITQVGALVCWDAQYGNTGLGALSGIPSGVFIDVALYGNLEGCAITSTGTVECWGTLPGIQTNKPGGSGYTRIGESGSSFCAAGPAGGECWGNNGANVSTIPPGNYVQVEGPYGLLSSGELVYFYLSGVAVSEELFVALDKTAVHSVGVTTDGRLAPLMGRSNWWPGR